MSTIYPQSQTLFSNTLYVHGHKLFLCRSELRRVRALYSSKYCVKIDAINNDNVLFTKFYVSGREEPVNKATHSNAR